MVTPRPQKRLTNDEKVMVMRGYEQNMTPTAIGVLLNKSANSIAKYRSRKKYLDLTGPVEKHSRKWIDHRMGRIIKDVVMGNAKLSLGKIRRELVENLPDAPWYFWGNIRVPGKTTLGKYLKEEGFTKRIPTLKAPLSPQNQANRLAYAQRWLVEPLGNVIWSDETRVASNLNNRKVPVWTDAEEQPRQIKIHSGGNSVMFWGCMSKHGTGPLHSINGYMNGDVYMDILKESVFPELAAGREIEDIDGPWRFMQDNASCHKRKDVMELLEANQANVIDWPPYSPDLNPIEHVWQWIKHELEVEYSVPNSAEEIEHNIMQIWRTITPEMCARWCDNYENRLRAVVQAGGAWTKY